MSETLLATVRALQVTDPDIGFKSLLAKLREQQPDLEATSKEVRKALAALKAESDAKAATSDAAVAASASTLLAAADEGGAPPPASQLITLIFYLIRLQIYILRFYLAGVFSAVVRSVFVAARSICLLVTAAAAAAPPAAEEGGAPPPASLPPNLACIGCGRLPSDMDDEREKHLVCHKCVKQKLPTTYWCGIDCPANPGAWKLHAVFHKEVKKHRQKTEDGGVTRQRCREVAELDARAAAETGDKYTGLMAECARYASEADWRRSARACRKAIALEPYHCTAYFNLGSALNNSGHKVEAAQRYLEAKERRPVGSDMWARATAEAFDMLMQKECEEVAKPDWWNDEGLKALSARVVRAALDVPAPNYMRAVVLSGAGGASWGAGPRSSAEFTEAAARFDRAAELWPAPAGKAELAVHANQCRRLAIQATIQAMCS